MEGAVEQVEVVADGEGGAEGDGVDGFLEFVVVGAEEDGFAEGECFEDVVYAVAETAADVGDGGVAVEFGEESDVVDDEDVVVVVVGVGGELGVGDGVREKGLDLEDVLPVDEVWSDDGFGGEPVGFGVAGAGEDLFVGWPCASGYEDVAVVSVEEVFDDGVGEGGGGYLVDAVEACVAGEGAVADVVAVEELEALCVLDEEVGEGEGELAEEPPAVGLEEVLVGAEDGGEEVGGNVTEPECAEVVVPEFVFDEEGGGGVSGGEEAACVAGCVGR